jgi:aryl sulfotransferase
MPQHHGIGDLPAKTREIFSIYSDSTRWNEFKFRDDDVVIVTWAKSGTTWTQQIVSQLIFDGKEGINVWMLCPWVDMRIVPQEAIDALEFQTHRRFVKTHLPVDALVISPKAKYIYIGRDGRDAAWSAYNHMARGASGMFESLNSLPGRDGPPLERPTGSVHDFWLDWLAHDGTPFWPFWEHIRGWWGIRDQPNVKFLHFNDLKHDLAGQVRGIADFLNIEVQEATFPAILEHCTFDYMKAHAELYAPLGGAQWEGGASTFINKGTNGRWHDVLSAEECADYEARAVAELGPDCAHWLKTGEMPRRSA